METKSITKGLVEAILTGCAPHQGMTAALITEALQLADWETLHDEEGEEFDDRYGDRLERLDHRIATVPGSPLELAVIIVAEFFGLTLEKLTGRLLRRTFYTDNDDEGRAGYVSVGDSDYTSWLRRRPGGDKRIEELAVRRDSRTLAVLIELADASKRVRDGKDVDSYHNNKIQWLLSQLDALAAAPEAS